jgi:hypothetical protein
MRDSGHGLRCRSRRGDPTEARRGPALALSEGPGRRHLVRRAGRRVRPPMGRNRPPTARGHIGSHEDACRRRRMSTLLVTAAVALCHGEVRKRPEATALELRGWLRLPARRLGARSAMTLPPPPRPAQSPNRTRRKQWRHVLRAQRRSVCRPLSIERCTQVDMATAQFHCAPRRRSVTSRFRQRQTFDPREPSLRSSDTASRAHVPRAPRLAVIGLDARSCCHTALRAFSATRCKEVLATVIV